MKPAFAVASLVLTAGVLTGQLALEASFVTDTEFVAETSVLSQQHRSAWVVGTDLTPAPVLSSSNSGMASAMTMIGWSNTGRGLTASITETHTIGGVVPSVWARTGGHNARLRLSSRQPTPVRVRLSVTGTTLTPSSPFFSLSYSGAIDFGADGQWDVGAATGATQSRERLVTLDATGIQIVTRSGGMASNWHGGGSATSRCEVRIEVVPADQVVVDWQTATPISCSARILGIPNWTATLASGSSLWPWAGVTAGSSNTVAVGTRMTSAPDRVVAALTEQLNSDAIIPVHDSILIVRAPTRVPLRLSIRISAGASSANTADWSAALDIGDDGSFEVNSVLNRTVAHEASVVADAAGLRLRLRAQGAASMGTSANGLVEIEVLPAAACPAVPRGSACGVTLSGLVTLTSRLELDVTTPSPGTLAKLLLGTQQTDLPLPFSACRLYTYPIVAVPFMTGATGSARLGFEIPIGVSGIVVVQTLALARSQPLELAASRALDAACR